MGSALVATMVAGVGVLALSSRVAESRFASFTRSDSLAAREAAEFGLNEIQAKLNSVTVHGGGSSGTVPPLTAPRNQL